MTGRQGFRNPLVVLAAVLGALALAIVAGFYGQAVAQEQRIQPTVVPAEALTPAPTPPDNRQVAILTLVIASTDEGKVERVALERGRIVRSYAPHVLVLDGPWTIELVGRETIRYGALDPRAVEVETDDEEAPYTYIIETSALWELVVPLFENGKDLEVKEINIYDQDGNLIFSTPVDREAWGRQ